MNATNLGVTDLGQFLNGTDKVSFSASSKKASYEEIASKLKQWRYFKQSKKIKSEIREYLQRCTGYSHSQLTRLIAKYRKQRTLIRQPYQRHCFAMRYTRADILVLARTDECHQTLSGGATKKLFERAYYQFHDEAYVRLKDISIAHLYNLRESSVYRHKRYHFTKTKPTRVALGERRKPQPNGKPGYLRIDTVHQGDQDGKKGVYHINAVDEVTQMEIVSSVETISENNLIPVLEMLLQSFPFKIIEMHSDNGSEYINQYLVKLLNKLLIELTKSRPRHSNDNALAECKNGAIVRKWLGYIHIPQCFAEQINHFYREHFNPYINYHRPCYFPVIVIDKLGKEKKTYPYSAMMTPYEKFLSLDNPAQYLKTGLTLEMLNTTAHQMTDLASAEQTHSARKKLFDHIFKPQSLVDS